LILGYVGQTKYGIWLTIASVVGWFSILDIGLGQGLRNRFAEAISRDDDEQAKTYVSTAYALLSVIIFSFIVVFSVAHVYIPWHSILNVPEGMTINLKKFVLIVFGFYSLRFILKLITRIVIADQKPAIKDAILAIGKVFILITLYVLYLTVPGNLIYLALAYAGLPVVVLFLATLYLFKYKYKRYAPSFEYIKLVYGKDLLGLGWKFFLIQISLVVILMTDNIIITQLFGPAQVTPYQIVSKYFSLVLLLFTVITSPLWSATSEALVKNDYAWIKSSVRKLEKVALIFTFISILMFIFTKSIISFWVGDSIQVSYLLSFFWMFFVIIRMFEMIYFQVTNAAGKLNLPLNLFLIGMVLNIPLSIFFAKNLNMGISGVILATVICLSLHLTYLPFLYRSIINS
jgi:O-antigen/teichoic acid export membrane protein